MKIAISLLILFSTSNSFAGELSPKVKKIIFNEIKSVVFFEDEGAVREPQKIADFNFKQVKPSLILVVGDSFSDWDRKVIHYACEVKVLNRSGIKSSKDIMVNCSIEGENWPND